MRVIDELGGIVEEPNLSLGKLVPEKILIERHAAVPEQERIEEPDESNIIEEFTDENGEVVGRTIGVKIVQEYRPATPAWDEYEDVLRYILYTQAELDDMAAKEAADEAERKAAAEAAAAAAALTEKRNEIVDTAPGRFDGLEGTQLDHDEAIATLYESMSQAQLDSDEAITALYETITGGIHE